MDEFLKTNAEAMTELWRRQGEHDRLNETKSYCRKRLRGLKKFHPYHPMTEAYEEAIKKENGNA